MVVNKAAVLAATAVLIEAALGFNAHGHHHAHIDKRALETDWVTEWVTVWVTPGQELAAAPTTTAKATVTKAAKKKSKNKTKSAVYNVPTTTSTTVVVVPTSTAEAEGVYSQPQTTLTTVVKPKSEVVEAPKYTTTTQEAAAAVPTTSEEAAAAVPTTSEAVVVEKATTTKAAAAATTSKKAKATGSTSSSSAGLSSKRGMGYNSGDLANTFGSSCDNCGWGYNWDSTSDGLDSNYDYIPQLWGGESDENDHTERWEANLATCFEATNKPKAIFSFNEPDMPNQANMTAVSAAEQHVKYLNPHSDKALIGAPSISNSGDPGQGLEWLSSWIDECDKLSGEKCHYDFCNIHWYSQAAYSDTLFTQLEKAHDLCGKPIWLTEFAPVGENNTPADPSTISSFLEEVIPKLEALDYVHAYAYFMVDATHLMSSDSTLSTYGQTYASL